MPLKNHLLMRVLLVLLVGLIGYVNAGYVGRLKHFVEKWYLKPGPNYKLDSLKYPRHKIHGKHITFYLNSTVESRFVFNCTVSLPKRGDCSEGELSFFENYQRKVKLCTRISSYPLEFIGNKITVEFHAGINGKPLFKCDVEVKEETRPGGSDPGVQQGFLGLGGKSASCSCGSSNRKFKVGDQERKVNEYVFLAVIKLKKEVAGFCGGSIITRRHVLTAAHCIKGKSRRKLEVVLGVYQGDGEGVSQTRGVEKKHIHQDYQKKTKRSDIGILFLSDVIQFGPNVGRVCLPTGHNMLPNQSITALGWDLSGPSSTNGSQTSKSVDLQVIDMESCANSYTNDPVVISKDTQLCTKDLSQGDAGGPLVSLDPELKRYVQVALVSHIGNQSVNTLVFPFFDWIQKKVAEDSPKNTPYYTCDLLELHLTPNS